MSRHDDGDLPLDIDWLAEEIAQYHSEQGEYDDDVDDSVWLDLAMDLWDTRKPGETKHDLLKRYTEDSY